MAWLLQVLDSVGKHQVLIFVHSRKETAKTARYLKEEALKDDKLAQFMQVCHLSFKTRRWVRLSSAGTAKQAGHAPVHDCFFRGCISLFCDSLVLMQPAALIVAKSRVDSTANELAVVLHSNLHVLFQSW